MSELPGPSAPDFADSKTSNAPRRIGEYLLVAQLGDDALGSVYRALHTGDGRFVRLRVLQSPEISPARVLAAAERQASEHRGRSNVSCHGELHVAETMAYLIWPERNGWTLDFVLARARAGGWGMPIEFALMIAERAAAQIDRSSAAGSSGQRVHGALWPGFVSISSDAEVSVGGFGLAPVILPALSRPRMWRDVAPYIAPEIRGSGEASQRGDVYSLGVLLTELLTGQRASADVPPQRWRADDDFSQEVSLLLSFALSSSSERFATLRELHASLQALIASCPFETSPADLALFLYDLLNPDSRILPAPFDGTSTNPLASTRFRILKAETESAVLLEPVPSAAASLSPRTASADEEEACAVPEISVIASHARPVFWIRWTCRAAAVAAAIVGLFLLDRPIRHAALGPNPIRPTAAALPTQGGPSFAAMAAPGMIWPASVLSETSPQTNAAHAVRHSALRAGSGKRKSDLHAEAETLRLKAALARIEAEQLDASIHAAETFVQAKGEERQAEDLLRRRQFMAAREAYARALDLFTQARSQSREERVRRIQIAGDVSGS